MNQTQFKIRIRLDQSADHSVTEHNLPELPEEEAIPLPLPVYEYNWPRIIAAGLALLFVLVAFVWMITSWVVNNDDPETNPAEIPLSITPLSGSDPSSAESLSTATSAVTSPSNVTENKLEATNTSNINNSNTPDPAAKVLAPLPGSAKPVASKPPIKPGIKPHVPAIQTTKIHSTKGVNTAPGLVTAQLTSSIQNRQPVDHINQISLGGKSSRPVFLFLHLNKLKGEKIDIDWYYRNQHIAKISLLVGNNDWRTYSSKVLNQNRLGPWRVTASNQAGNLLAEFKFQVTR